LGSKTTDCVLIGYAQNGDTYRSLILRSGVLNQNTIIETNYAKIILKELMSVLVLIIICGVKLCYMFVFYKIKFLVGRLIRHLMSMESFCSKFEIFESVWCLIKVLLPIFKREN